RAHLRYFTELTVAATAHLWRREQLDWLATLGTEQANIVAAMRAALAHGEAEPAMRLAAGAGWYWWLAGHKAEGLELITAALELPGEVPDQIRAMVAALLVQFLTAGFGDEQRAAHWIREATRLSRGLPEDQARHPALRATLPLERVLRDPAHAAEAFTVLLDEEDPWLRAIGRLHLGKQRALRGDGSTEVDAALAAALTEFRAVGERFGISFALTELADRIAARGEFARACAHYREAIAAVTEIGAVDDVIRMQIRLAQLLWLAGEPEASAAAAAVADRYADGATWPDTLAQLALARAGLARWNGDPDEARRQLGRAVELLEDVLQAESMRAWISHLRAYAAEDAEQARELRRATCRFAAGSGHPTAIAQVLVGVADQALGDGDRERAARLLGAAERQLGLSDRSNPDLVRIEREVRDRLGAAGYGELRAEGAAADWMRLVEETLGAVR
ncbi:MAG TPA: AfsR/SARP family transcriptional regulator, partial [Microlunatus sp.]|nr:AfsR/SARP family transcriptional regulator [Microlunatus sp.]